MQIVSATPSRVSRLHVAEVNPIRRNAAGAPERSRLDAASPHRLSITLRLTLFRPPAAQSAALPLPHLLCAASPRRLFYFGRLVPFVSPGTTNLHRPAHICGLSRLSLLLLKAKVVITAELTAITVIVFASLAGRILEAIL